MCDQCNYLLPFTKASGSGGGAGNSCMMLSAANDMDSVKEKLHEAWCALNKNIKIASKVWDQADALEEKGSRLQRELQDPSFTLQPSHGIGQIMTPDHVH